MGDMAVEALEKEYFLPSTQFVKLLCINLKRSRILRFGRIRGIGHDLGGRS